MRPEGEKFRIKNDYFDFYLGFSHFNVRLLCAYIVWALWGGVVIINYYLTLVSYLKGCGDPILINCS